MAIKYSLETITTKAGKQTNVVAKDFDYKKDSAWYYAHGFRYFNANYNKKAGGEAVATFGVNAETLKAKYPKVYNKIMAVINGVEETPDFSKMTGKQFVAWRKAYYGK